MKKWRWKCLLAFSAVATALIVLLRLSPAPRTVTSQQLKAAYNKAAQRLYRHEILSLYHPPEEAFTPHGLQLLHQIQNLYSPIFVPYLVMGSVPVQPDVLYNPWFDLFILVEDSDGHINSVLLASSRSSDQSPQLAVTEKFWQEVYRRYQVARMASFSSPKPFDETDRAILELRNLTNRFGWPARVQLPDAGISFELYIQRPTQAIYCNPIEPGTFVVFNYHDDRLYTNVVSLPPYAVREVEKQVEETFQAARQNTEAH
jgi:hypothetical protein